MNLVTAIIGFNDAKIPASISIYTALQHSLNFDVLTIDAYIYIKLGVILRNKQKQNVYK